MNIQVTNQEKYNNVKKVWNYGAKLIDDTHVDGHLSVTFIEEGKQFTAALMGFRSNSDLEKDYGFRFVQHENNIDNGKYYF